MEDDGRPSAPAAELALAPPTGPGPAAYLAAITGISRADREADLVPQLVGTVAEARERLDVLQGFVQEVLVEGEDYGFLGDDDGKQDDKRKKRKRILFKSGAEKLCEGYGITPVSVVMLRLEDFETGLFHYEVRVDLYSKRSGLLMGSSAGSCNSYESRYRWRQGGRTCPTCGAAAIKISNFGDKGFYCFQKIGGCNAKFPKDDKRITDQTVGRVQNPDLADMANTCLKMARKRALVDVTITATRSSGMFTQDEELLGHDDRGGERDAGPGGQPDPVPPPGATSSRQGGGQQQQGRSAPPPARPAATPPPAAAPAASSAPPATVPPAGAAPAAAAAPAPAPATSAPPAAATAAPAAPAALVCGCPCGCGASITQSLADYSTAQLGAYRCRACYPFKHFDDAKHPHPSMLLELPKYPEMTAGQASESAAAERAREAGAAGGQSS